MLAKVVFVCPASVAPVAEKISEYGGTIEYDERCESQADYEALLSDYVGQVVTIEFEPGDSEDGDEAVRALAGALDKQDAHYVAMFDAFVEARRGVRVEGAVIVNEGAGSREFKVPWKNGPVDFDVLTLSVGMSVEESRSLIEKFLNPPVASTPKSF